MAPKIDRDGSIEMGHSLTIYFKGRVAADDPHLGSDSHKLHRSPFVG